MPLHFTGSPPPRTLFPLSAPKNDDSLPKMVRLRVVHRPSQTIAFTIAQNRRSHHCRIVQSPSQLLSNRSSIAFRNMMTAAVQCYKATLSVTIVLSAPFNNLAIIYKQQSNYADVISCYNEVLRIDPLATDGLVNRGNTYKEIGRVNEAVQDYSRAIIIRPNMAEAHANLASACKDRWMVGLTVLGRMVGLTVIDDCGGF